MPAIGMGEMTHHEGTKDTKEKGAKPVLSERDQKVVAILGKMTGETWEKDRDAVLAVLLI